MKKIFLFLLLFCIISITQAQLTITPGAQFVLTGNVQLTLSDIDFVNQGNFSAGNGSLLFTGKAVNIITGSQNMTLYDLNIGKTSGSVQLQVPITVSHQVIFTNGVLDLNANDLNLGTTGSLNGEQEISHIVGFNGGTVITNANLNAPSSVNPGNLGIIITSSQNLGNTVIKRGHQTQTNNSGGGNSILRYYDIAPANNTLLNATLRFNYLTAELNGLDENALVEWEKQNTQNWQNLGFDARNTTSNYVEENTISTFGRFTLSSLNNALPVHFIAFNTSCNGSAVLISWKTAEELNSRYYAVEKSNDGIQWNTIGNVPAAGNSTAENDYSYIDNSVSDNSYYRIAGYDLDGNITFTNTVQAACGSQEAFKIWPNPASEILYINMTVRANTQEAITLFDGKGALVKRQNENITAGNNLISINIKGLAAGMYFLNLISNSGQVQTQKLIIK